MTRTALTSLAASRVLVALPADGGERLAVACEILAQEGVEVVALAVQETDRIATLTDQLGGRLLFGAHGVTSVADLTAAADAGAAFVTSSTASAALSTLASGRGIEYFAGGLSPTELAAAWAMGPTGVLVHPAEVLGTQYAPHARAAVPGAPLIAGSVGTYAAGRWYAGGALAVQPDADLFGDVLTGGDYGSFRDRARSFVTEGRAAADWAP